MTLDASFTHVCRASVTPHEGEADNYQPTGGVRIQGIATMGNDKPASV